MDLGLLQYGEAGYGDQLLAGLVVTLTLAVSAFVSAALIGLVAAVAIAENPVLTKPWKAYRSIITGVPSLLIIFFLYFNLPAIGSMLFGRSLQLGPWAAGYTALVVVYSAYMIELYLGTIGAIGSGQREAAEALGLRRPAKWIVVLVPQMLRLATAGLANLWVVVLKETTLVSLVGLTDIIRVSNVAARSTGRPLLFFLTVAVIFIVLGLLTQMMSRYLEKRLAMRG